MLLTFYIKGSISNIYLIEELTLIICLPFKGIFTNMTLSPLILETNASSAGPHPRSVSMRRVSVPE